jgi:hypothetical protein
MYFITCFEKYEIDNKTNIPDIGENRAVGYYSHKSMAVEDLNKNNCDMYEYLYKYAVIEKIPMGLYPIAEETTFFEWNEEKQGYFEVEDQTQFDDIFGNYAFG